MASEWAQVKTSLFMMSTTRQIVPSIEHFIQNTSVLFIDIDINLFFNYFNFFFTIFGLTVTKSKTTGPVLGSEFSLNATTPVFSTSLMPFTGLVEAVLLSALTFSTFFSMSTKVSPDAPTPVFFTSLVSWVLEAVLLLTISSSILLLTSPLASTCLLPSRVPVGAVFFLAF